MKLILKLKYRDWSRLSKEFLTEIETMDEETGELISIIEMLWRKNENIMELLSYKYDFSNRIKEYNGINEKEKNITYEDLVKDLQISPSVKKMIWRALVIVKEIKKVTNKSPKKVFIEMARDTQTEKKRTEKRKDKLLELYKNIKNDDSIKELEKNLKDKTNDDLKSKKLYLYYLQLGRCMYSGEVIRLEDLMNDNLYDIDHIYPQSKIKDDSFDNTVLVKKQINADKTNEYPIDKSIQNKCKAFWTSLKERGLMSNTKYERLTRTEGFSDDELAGFISRQIVETRQATKVLADLLKMIFGSDTRIVYVKAGLTSDFRQKFGIYKFRELNDYHHAHDGYLNIVTGNIYNTLFTDNPYNFIKDRKKDNRTYNLNRVFERENDVWNPDTMISKIERYIYKIRPLFTRASYERKGKFYNIQYVKKGKNLISKKNNLNTEKYGGYSGIENSYFVIYLYKQKNKDIKKIDTIPVYLREKINSDKDIMDYLKEKNKIEGDIKILENRIKIGSKIRFENEIYYLKGKPDENRLSVGYMKQLILSKSSYEVMRKIIKNIEKLNLENTEEKLSKILKNSKNSKELTTKEINIKINTVYGELYEKISEKEFGKIFSTITIPLKEYLAKSNLEILEDFNKLDIFSKIRVLEEIFKVITKLDNFSLAERSEERRVGKECRSRWSPYH